MRYRLRRFRGRAMNLATASFPLPAYTGKPMELYPFHFMLRGMVSLRQPACVTLTDNEHETIHIRLFTHQ